MVLRYSLGAVDGDSESLGHSGASSDQQDTVTTNITFNSSGTYEVCANGEAESGGEYESDEDCMNVEVSGGASYTSYESYEGYEGYESYESYEGYEGYEGDESYTSYESGEGYTSYEGYEGYEGGEGYTSYEGGEGYTSYEGGEGYGGYEGPEGGVPACSDGMDNDGDGFTDMNDPGCDNPNDDDESDDPAECRDGVDNDGDGKVDMNDSGCSSPTDNNELSQCDDGVDNDGDGEIDFPDDPDCDSRADNKEGADMFRFFQRDFWEI